MQLWLPSGYKTTGGERQSGAEAKTSSGDLFVVEECDKFALINSTKKEEKEVGGTEGWTDGRRNVGHLEAVKQV